MFALKLLKMLFLVKLVPEGIFYSSLCSFPCSGGSKSFSVAILAANDGPQSPFHHILPKCKLARDLKEAYDR